MFNLYLNPCCTQTHKHMFSCVRTLIHTRQHSILPSAHTKLNDLAIKNYSMVHYQGEPFTVLLKLRYAILMKGSRRQQQIVINLTSSFRSRSDGPHPLSLHLLPTVSAKMIDRYVDGSMPGAPDWVIMSGYGRMSQSLITEPRMLYETDFLSLSGY